MSLWPELKEVEYKCRLRLSVKNYRRTFEFCQYSCILRIAYIFKFHTNVYWSLFIEVRNERESLDLNVFLRFSLRNLNRLKRTKLTNVVETRNAKLFSRKNLCGPGAGWFGRGIKDSLDSRNGLSRPRRVPRAEYTNFRNYSSTYDVIILQSGNTNVDRPASDFA